MKNPQEKAFQIYQKMKGFRVKNSHAKKCALVCVDEIINEDYIIHSVHSHLSRNEYWADVKKEIEKL